MRRVDVSWIAGIVVNQGLCDGCAVLLHEIGIEIWVGCKFKRVAPSVHVGGATTHVAGDLVLIASVFIPGFLEAENGLRAGKCVDLALLDWLVADVVEGWVVEMVLPGLQGEFREALLVHVAWADACNCHDAPRLAEGLDEWSSRDVGIGHAA